MKAIFFIGLLGLGALIAQEQGIKKWYGPELKLPDDQVVVFEDGFARCYAVRDIRHNFGDLPSTNALAMSCIPLKGNR